MLNERKTFFISQSNNQTIKQSNNQTIKQSNHLTLVCPRNCDTSLGWSACFLLNNLLPLQMTVASWWLRGV